MIRVSTLQLVQQLQSGALSARFLTEQCLATIEQRNPILNAFVLVDAERALKKADDIDARRSAGQSVGPMAGLPFAVKDNICVTGMRTTCGSRILNNFVPPYDAHVIERLEASDGILIGKLNQDEFAMGSSTETSIFGAGRNPWDPNRSAGGSSGGAAIAVASGERGSSG